MSKVTIDGLPKEPLRAPSTMSERILQESAGESDPTTPEAVEEALTTENMSVDERIRRAKESTQVNYNRSREQQVASNKDRYKNESGKTTYYYENISTFIIAWSHPEKNIPPPEIGGAIDFYDYFDKEEDILHFKAIRKNEFPNNVKPSVRRLTPEEYLRKIERNRKLESQKNQYLSEAKGRDKTTEDDKVSSAVQFRVNEYITWEALPKDEQVKRNYSKYEFMQWVAGWIFSEPEFRMMLYQIRDPEVIKAIAERKQELNAH